MHEILTATFTDGVLDPEPVHTISTHPTSFADLQFDPTSFSYNYAKFGPHHHETPEVHNADTSFAWGGERHEHVPHSVFNSYFKEGGSSSSTAPPQPIQKYMIEEEGPGFRSALQREIDKIMHGPDGPYAKRSVETYHGQAGDRPIMDASLAPDDIKFDDGVKRYFDLMNKMLKQQQAIPHYDEKGNLIQPEVDPNAEDGDAVGPPQDDDGSLAPPMPMEAQTGEAEKSWLTQMSEFFSGTKSSDQIAQEEADKIFGNLDGDDVTTSIDAGASSSHQRPRSEPGYLDSLFRLFGGRPKTLNDVNLYAVKTGEARVQAMPFSPAVITMVDESISYIDRCRHNAQRTCGGFMSAML